MCAGSRIGDRAIWHAIRAQLLADAQDLRGALGSLASECKLAGAKVNLVMGHAACGAIEGAIDNAALASKGSIPVAGSMVELETGVLRIDA